MSSNAGQRGERFHPNERDDQSTGLRIAERGDRDRVAGGADLVARHPQQQGQALGRIHVVVHHKDAASPSWHLPPFPTLLVAQPWDPSQISAIEKGIRAADLGLNPSNDGKVVRIPIPPLTEERRKELVKRAHDMAEHARTGVRSARREGKDKLKAMEKDKKLGQDDERRGLEEVQRLHDHYIGDIGKSLEHKEKDILAL